MGAPLRWVASLCFIFSGAASVSYQMIWLRQAMTYFGVITPVNSAVLSVFMLGLALGTVAVGRRTLSLSGRWALWCYALVEMAIAVLAVLVPYAFQGGYWVLLGVQSGQSGEYLFWSFLLITLILLPVCTLIGATFPLLMKYLETAQVDRKNFSLLYFANLFGALLGCVFPCVLIELYGFSGALYCTALLNLAALALALYALRRGGAESGVPEEAAFQSAFLTLRSKVILFALGFIALGCEIVWVKAFMPVIGPTVYSFAAILAIYLVFNALGTSFYRQTLHSSRSFRMVAIGLPLGALLPILGSSHVVMFPLGELAILSLALVCFCFGYLTPKIVDDVCGDHPRTASLAYMYNCVGCILGPLVATYLLFPSLGIKGSLLVFAAGAFLVATALLHTRRERVLLTVLCAAALPVAMHFPNSEDSIVVSGGRLERDHIGYIGAVGEGMDKRLLVNGIGMTSLTQVTKNMAHLPMAHHPEAQSALVICFGMGTTVRSLTGWPLHNITAVELSEGVIRSFPYFHDDAQRVLGDSRVHVVADDGRRFLNRSRDSYDIIIIDPPPPIQAAGSGLLYTTEFLSVLKQRLAPGGILQHWIPNDSKSAFVNGSLAALKNNFRHVKVFASVDPAIQGVHFLASDSPLPELAPEEFARRLPSAAVTDIEEWNPGIPLTEIAQRTLRPVTENAIKNPRFDGVIMSDDRLYNEFFLLHGSHPLNP